MTVSCGTPMKTDEGEPTLKSEPASAAGPEDGNEEFQVDAKVVLGYFFYN